MQDERAVADTPSVAERVLHSDPHDFAGLYIRHRASFTLHARRYLRDARDADEVVQEAFLRLFLALPELETELQALAYCRRTITNLCIDRFRAQARRPSLVDLDSAGALDLADDDPGDPVVRAEDAATVRAALSLLSPLHRAALVKREIEEKPLPVIAQELQIPEESVKHVLFRARRALRRLLAGTSLVPGSNAELSRTLGAAARASSGGLAAFFLLLFLGLGTGPDLRSIPVVGADLPELIPVTTIAQAMGDAVVHVADAVASTVGVSRPTGTEAPGADEAGPLAAPAPSPSKAARPSPAVAPAPEPEKLAPPTPAPVSTASPAAPTPAPKPSASGSPAPEASGSPSPAASPAASTSPSPSAQPSPGAASPSPVAAPGTKEKPRSAPSPSPSPSGQATYGQPSDRRMEAAQPDPEDPDA